MTVTYPDVASAAQEIAKNNGTPTVRSVRAYLGTGSDSTIAPLVKQWKEARAAHAASVVELNPAINDLILAQMEQGAKLAASEANQRCDELQSAFEELATRAVQIEALLEARNGELSALQTQLLQQQGQLKERAREIADLNQATSLAVAKAEAGAARERQVSESLRQHLVLDKLKLESLPRIEASLQEARLLLSTANEEVARAKQSEAVADARAAAQSVRANEAASREIKMEAQLVRLQEERQSALNGERLSQKEVLKLTSLVSSLEARCKSFEATLKRATAKNSGR